MILGGRVAGWPGYYGAKISPEKLNPLSRVHARHRRQTDGFAMPLAKRNVVTFGKKTEVITQINENVINRKTKHQEIRKYRPIAVIYILIIHIALLRKASSPQKN